MQARYIRFDRAMKRLQRNKAWSKAWKKAKFLIAAKMKKQGISTDMIAPLNGLTTTEIENL